MKITKREVEHVARLARLELTEEEKERFTRELNSILTYFDKLNELNTEDVEPTSHVIPIVNVFREDEVRPSYPREEVLSNAPEEEEAFFKVPRILE
ncbi:MAG: Asp-tRNA(Asn)/Glu-tRNA(Gln) amidotransferase subunit GatC [candidate division NC10 bacterium]|nr:Asp-tRNA(Asn)/Glu-tRNA(Gln) amidotransferase subunit GatC [candidate division NC10 bacterium]